MRRVLEAATHGASGLCRRIWSMTRRVPRSEHECRRGLTRSSAGAPVRPGEEGAATVLVLALISMLVTVAVAGTAVGGLLVGQRRAASAADLAALAAAEAVGPGGATAQSGSSACQEASRLSTANRARLTGCLVEGDEVVVEVEVDVPGLFGATWHVPGRARAGPTRELGATSSDGPGP